MSSEESYQTIVVGGGQAGLAAGYFLAQQGQDFLILDGSPRTGDTWRNRWDSLRLFTPSQFDGLPGRPFGKPDQYFPTKDEVAGYLEAYARQFELPIRHGVTVETLSQADHAYRLVTSNASFIARNVIVATGAYQVPSTPPFASQLDPAIQQIHSSAYRNPEQIPGQTVLVAGAGNSGVEIGLELARAGRRAWLAGRDVGHIPADTLGKAFGGRPYWWFLTHVLSINTPVGRKMRGNVLYHGNPLIRSNRQEVVAAGITCTPRLAGVQDGKPRTEDGQVLPVDCVIWATGYRPNYSWIDLPIFDEHGYPRHQRGVIPGFPGLYFVGLHFQTALSSALLGGVGSDAAYITRWISSHGPRA